MDIFESFCRTCGNECLEPLNIFDNTSSQPEEQEKKTKKVSLTEMLSTCLPASLPALDKTDDYPKQICRICVKKLEISYEFHQSCLGAHSEFNVALKFEQRRKRSRLQQQQQQQQTPTPPPAKPQPPIEYTVMTVDVNGEAEEATPESANTITFKIEPGMTVAEYKCGICSERFRTEKACKFHCKFAHRNLFPS